MKYVWKEKSSIQQQITQASVIVMLDYDGTLTPIVDTPTAAVLAPTTKALLQNLTERRHTKVCIITGRSLADIRERVGIAAIDYAGVHGYESDMHATELATPQTHAVMDKLRRAIGRLSALFPGVLLEDKTISFAIHYRMVSAGNVPKLLRRISDIVAPYKVRDGVVIKKGKKVLELFVDARWNKGEFVKMYLEKIREGSSQDKIVIYIGDDITDEDAFVQLPNEITIHVGKKRSKARYWVSDVSEVLTFLSWIVQTRA